MQRKSHHVTGFSELQQLRVTSLLNGMSKLCNENIPLIAWQESADGLDCDLQSVFFIRTAFFCILAVNFNCCTLIRFMSLNCKAQNLEVGHVKVITLHVEVGNVRDVG